MSRLPKAQHVRQNRERRDLGVIQGGALDPGEPPKAPYGILKPTKQRWERFWRSSLGTSPMIRPDIDADAVADLFRLIDERERAYRAYRRERMILGSQGQKVLNPQGRIWMDLDKQVQRYADQIGLTPMARLKLGITFGDYHHSLEEMNQRMNNEPDEADDEDDPRIIEVQAKSG